MRLVFDEGSYTGQAFPLDRSPMTIGRGADNDLVLAESGVSRHHARLHHLPHGWVLTDLNSTNGTYVNQRRIGEDYVLQPGDLVTIGSTVMRVQSEQSDLLPEEYSGPQTGVQPAVRPVLVIVGALCLVVVLVGIVLLLVTVLQPEDAATEVPPTRSMDELITALPVPTQLRDVVTAVVPLIRTGLPIFPLGATPTPEPGSSLDRNGQVAHQMESALPALQP